MRTRRPLLRPTPLGKGAYFYMGGGGREEEKTRPPEKEKELDTGRGSTKESTKKPEIKETRNAHKTKETWDGTLGEGNTAMKKTSGGEQPREALHKIEGKKKGGGERVF
eukprot:Hpha_TRINITY_DN16260_c0_g8::TRINITY_DN16260_c0_g8_i1::g.12938::m.12938